LTEETIVGSTIHLRKFEYFEPHTAREASQVLTEYGYRACVMAGGIDLLPRMRNGSIVADAVVNIGTIPGLDKMEYVAGRGFTFGAMAKLIDLDRNEMLAMRYPAVREAIHQITSVQSKYMGTAVGNLCLATPASDVVPALMCYDAELTIAGIKGERKLPLSEFYLDYRKTDLKDGEFVASVFIPAPAPGTGAAFLNRVRTYADIAKITVAAVVCEKEGVCAKARIAIGAAAQTVVRARDAEAVLTGKPILGALRAKAADAVLKSIAPISDFRSTEAYRTEMAKVLTDRALRKAFDAARGSEG
jgi:carbon-monoxide dehydrogenase medium subunit